MWSRTKAALTHLEELLQCDLCHHVVADPCTLGACDHFFCRGCLVPFIGKYCPTCSIPSFAKDIQPYHLIASTVLHCQELRTLLDSCNEVPANRDSVVNSGAKTDEQPDASLATMEKENVPQEISPESGHEDVFEFNPTPPFRKISRCRIPKLSKRRKITDNNKKWGIGSGASVSSEEPSRETNNEASHKRVSFDSSVCSTPLSELHPSSSTPKSSSHSKSSTSTPLGLGIKLNRSRFTPTSIEGGSRWKSFTAQKIKAKHLSGQSSDLQTSDKELYVSQNSDGLKTIAQKIAYSESSANRSHKRPVENCSSGRSLNALPFPQKSKKLDGKNVQSIETRRKSPTNTAAVKCSSTDVALKLNKRLNETPCNTSSKIYHTKDTLELKISENISKAAQDNNCLKQQDSASRRLSLDSSPPTPKSRKPNAKGETALHVASIKGNFERVQKLLQQGENPNVKDNAGWTPLHEACNHGFKNIVVLLLDNGALINAPGMNNDTPLHDAVTNYHLEVVRLLVSRGADVTLRNREGMTPKDYARTDEMRHALESPVLPAPLPVVVGSSSSSTRTVFLSTGLSQEERVKLQACADFLKAKIVSEFSSEVTHLITSCSKAGRCPRTLKYMHAVIAGKWIVRFDWIEACLSRNEHVNEERFEVEGSSSNPDSKAPKRARINSELQYPPIFDGCHFYFYGKYSNPTPSKSELINLAKSGGAQLLRREPKPSTLNVMVTAPYHATSSLKLCSHYIFYQKGLDEPIIQHNMERLRTLPVSWLLDSIAAFALLDPLPYLK